MYQAEDSSADTIYVFASKAGAPTNPDWYYNLTAAGSTTVEVGTETYEVDVAEVIGADRDRVPSVRDRSSFGDSGHRGSRHLLCSARRAPRVAHGTGSERRRLGFGFGEVGRSVGCAVVVGDGCEWSAALGNGGEGRLARGDVAVVVGPVRFTGVGVVVVVGWIGWSGLGWR
jgi:hypothetical protein